MRHAALALKLLVLVYLGYLAFFLVTAYQPELPGYDPPFVLWLLDTINLFIHEAGHLFFRPFGMWLHIIAGSLFQIAVPLALLLVTCREKPHQMTFPGFWLGESMVNVSVYIRDAPHMKLKLMASGLTHDWNYLIGGNRDTAEFLGGGVFFTGVTLCLAAICTGVWYALRSHRNN